MSACVRGADVRPADVRPTEDRLPWKNGYDDRSRLRICDARAARGAPAGRGNGRPRGADLSDQLLCFRKHRPRCGPFQSPALWEHLHAHHEPHHGSVRGADGSARTRRGRPGSWQAAQFVALASLLEAGDEMVAAKTLYGGTYTQFDVSFRRLGIQTTFVDPEDAENFRRAITPRTRLLYGETIGNPRINVLDIAAVAAVAHENNLPLMVDNTFASPYLCRPIEHGADIVVHSATKFIGGHGTSIGGVIVDSSRFLWDRGRFPQLLEPSKGYHGIRFYETFGDFAYIMKTRVEGLRDFGPALSPFNSFLFLQGLETLKLRMECHTRNATAVAGFLADHPRVAWVNYPGLPSNCYRALAQRYLPLGAGG